MPMKHGSVLSETVLVMPVLFLLIFGVIQFALVWTARQMTAYAAFCATRAIMVVPRAEQQKAARDAAKVALSWMALADEGQGARVTIPGWGAVPGSGTIEERLERDDGDEAVKILENGTKPVAAVRVTFRFPLMIPGMAVNRMIGNAKNAPELEGKADFYGDLNKAAGNPDEISGWPYIELTETCVLPMPYSTVEFPTGGFSGASATGGGS